MHPRRSGAVLLDVVAIGALAVAASAFGVSVVSGGSMEPALARGDLVLYRKGPGQVGSGRMVLLGTPRGEYVHRVVVRTARETILTRGDANPIADREETSVAAVRGTVVAVVPSGRLFPRLAASRR
ncbi:MAG TPA: S24/S26 family peptidase [Coriobacteriia bacterium]